LGRNRCDIEKANANLVTGGGGKALGMETNTGTAFMNHKEFHGEMKPYSAD